MAIQITKGQRVTPGQSNVQFAAPSVDNAAGRQLQQLGAATESTGSKLNALQIEAQEQVNETRVNEAVAEAQKEALRRQTQYSELRGSQAMPQSEALGGKPLAEKFGTEFDMRLPEIAQDLGLNAVQTERFRQRTMPLSASFFSQATTYERTQADAYSDDVYKTGVAAASESVLATWANPEAMALSLEEIRTSTLARAREKGLTPESAALAVRENTGKALLSVVEANADENPAAMRDFLDANRGRMLPSHVEAANNKINPGLAGIEADDWAENLLGGHPSKDVEPPVAGATVEFEKPSGTVTSNYGLRASFRTSNGQRASSDHDGIDFAGRTGDPVRSVAVGRVTRVEENNGGYGRYIEVEHPDGTTTGYAHLNAFNVRVDDSVAKGQTIGALGSTGNVTGPHLHLRAMRDGKSIDPAELFSGNGTRTAQETAARESGSRPTRAEAHRLARERFGHNPVQRAAASGAIDRFFSLEDAEKRERTEQVRDSIYAHIEGTRTMPPPSMLAELQRLAPGSMNTVQNYFEAYTAPPVTRSDQDLLLAIYSDPSEVAALTPDEITARYGKYLSRSDLLSVVRMTTAESARGAAQLAKDAQQATVVPGQAFSRAWTRALDTRGIDRTPSGRTADADRQSLAQMSTEVRDSILTRQSELGRQLNEAEIEIEVAKGLGRLTWERPAGPLPWQGRQAGYATGYSSIPKASRDVVEDGLRTRLRRAPTEAEVYAEYLRTRISGSR